MYTTSSPRTRSRTTSAELLRHKRAIATRLLTGVGATPRAEERVEEAARRVTRPAVTAEPDAAAGIVTNTVSGIQIRRGPDGRWYPFTRSAQRWWPAPGASPQADAAFAAALRARRAR
jgi:hypothetical protein